MEVFEERFLANHGNHSSCLMNLSYLQKNKFLKDDHVCKMSMLTCGDGQLDEANPRQTFSSITVHSVRSSSYQDWLTAQRPVGSWYSFQSLQVMPRWTSKKMWRYPERPTKWISNQQRKGPWFWRFSMFPLKILKTNRWNLKKCLVVKIPFSN